MVRCARRNIVVSPSLSRVVCVIRVGKFVCLSNATMEKQVRQLLVSEFFARRRRPRRNRLGCDVFKCNKIRQIDIHTSSQERNSWGTEKKYLSSNRLN